MKSLRTWDQMPFGRVNIRRQRSPSSDTEGKEVKMDMNTGTFTGPEYCVGRSILESSQIRLPFKDGETGAIQW